MKPDADNSRNESRFSGMFRSMRYRNYRLFFFGQGVSIIGSWMQTTAMGWLVYRMTDSKLLLGVVAFASLVPSTLATPIAGVIADRHNRRRILVVTQTLAMIQAFVLAALYFTGALQVWHIVALGAFLGLVNSFDIPTRQSFVINMVEGRQHLGNAIALNSIIFNSARFVGPAIAGLLIGPLGEGGCFLINGVSFLAVIVALLAMRLPAHEPPAERKHILHELKEGGAYVLGHSPIRAILLLLALLSLLGMPYAVLMPVFARDILHGDAQTQGFLIAASGVGALFGSFYLASRRRLAGLERIAPVAAGVFGLALMVFSQSNLLWLSFGVLLIGGLAGTTNMVACNTVIQSIVEDSKRGRVMSFFTLSFIGFTPMGSLIAGAMAQRYDAPTTVFIGGCACVLGAILFSFNIPQLRKALDAVAR